MECVRCLNVANGRKSLLDLFPDVRTIVDSEVFEANIWSLQTPTSPFLNSSLFWQPPEFGNVKRKYLECKWGYKAFFEVPVNYHNLHISKW